MPGLSLDEDEEVGSALSLDGDDEPALKRGSMIYVIKLEADSSYNKIPAAELQGMVMTWTVTNVTDFDANTQANPGPAYREITVRQEGLLPI